MSIQGPGDGFQGAPLPAFASRARTLRFRSVTLVSVACLVLGGVGHPEHAHADWRPYRLDRWVQAKVTAYCPGPCCCGRHANGRTSTGRDARLPGAAVAPDAVPYGSMLWIDGAGFRLADDTGGAMRQSWRRRGVIHVDLRKRTHAEALRWGVRQLRMAIYRPAPPTPAASSGRLTDGRQRAGQPTPHPANARVGRRPESLRNQSLRRRAPTLARRSGR